MTATMIETQAAQNGDVATTWYLVDGVDAAYACEAHCEEFGACEDGTIVDALGRPLTTGTLLDRCLINLLTFVRA